MNLEIYKIKAKIINTVKNYFDDEDNLNQQIEERMYDYIDEDWQEDGEYESEYDWYQDFGRGEAEGELHNEILDEIKKKCKFENMDWYFLNLYGDIDSLIYKYWPSLQTN